MSDYKGVKEAAAELRDDLRLKAEELDEHNANCTVAEVGGAVVGLIGSAVILFGGSLRLGGSVDLAPLLLLGALVCVGTTLVNKSVDKDMIKRAEERRKEFETKFNMELKISQPKSDIQWSEIIKDLIKEYKEIIGAASVVAAFVQSKLSPKVTDAAQKTAEEVEAELTAAIAESTPKGVLHLVACLACVFSVCELYQAAMRRGEKAASRAGEHLRKMADVIDQLIKMVEKREAEERQRKEEEGRRREEQEALMKRLRELEQRLANPEKSGLLQRFVWWRK